MPASVAATIASVAMAAIDTQKSGLRYGHSRRPTDAGFDFVPVPIGLLRVDCRDVSLKESSGKACAGNAR